MKHNVLKDPAADAKLAAHLVNAMIGGTVPWPDAASIEDIDRSAWSLQLDDAPSEEESDDELEYCPGLEHFGVHKPLVAIVDCSAEVGGSGCKSHGQVGRKAAGCAAAVLADVDGLTHDPSSLAIVPTGRLFCPVASF